MHPNALLISDYVDDALAAAERADLERHLAGCETCRALADDLREVARAATELRTLEPPATAWRRVEKAIRSEAVSRPSADGAGVALRQSWRWLAAAALVVLATVVGLRMNGNLARQTSAGPVGTAASVPASAAGPAAPSIDSAQTVETELRQAEEHYDKAITGLEQIANADQSALDPGTAATLHKNLAVIDQAISESRAAVHSQPTSEPAQQSLLENFRTKITVLQDTVALINEMRKGNETGAARIVSGLKDKGD